MQQEQIVNLAVDAIAPSPFNPRKHLGDLTELASSIKQVGVLEPAVVRSVGGAPELVFGHRRHAAAKLAGLDALPCVVRKYSDDDVIEIQIVENGQRADVHPLDEADGYRVLVDRGRTVAQIADKVGRDRAYVAQRLELCRLSKKARAALDEGKLTLGAALALARVPGKLQDDALRDVLDFRSYDDEGAAVSGKAVRRHIEEHFMLELARAPWPRDDAQLHKKAGACTTCPKRTGSQPELFADVKAKDLCTDPDCYKSKLALYWPTRAKAAREAGQAVLEGDAAKKAMRYSGGYEKLADTAHIPGTGKSVSVRKLVEQAGAPVVLALNPETNEHVELVRSADLEKAMRAAAPEQKRSSGGYDAKTEQRKRDTKERKRKQLVELVAAAAAENAEGAKLELVLRLVVVALAYRSHNNDQKAVLERRSGERAKRSKTGTLEHGAEAINAKIVSLATGLPEPARKGLGVELGLRMFAPSQWSPAHALWFAFCKELKVDLKKLQAQVDAEERERSAKSKARGKKAKAPKRSKKASAAEAEMSAGACRECGCTEDEACETDDGPCYWADADMTICSACVDEAAED